MNHRLFFREFPVALGKSNEKVRYSRDAEGQTFSRKLRSKRRIVVELFIGGDQNSSRLLGPIANHSRAGLVVGGVLICEFLYKLRVYPRNFTQNRRLQSLSLNGWRVLSLRITFRLLQSAQAVEGCF